MRGESVAKNTVINLVGQILPLLVGIVTIPMLIKGLGTERFGVLTLAWMVIGYFSLFDLGLGRALTHIIAQRLGKEEARELPGLVWTALVIMAVMGVIGGGIAGALSPYLIAKVFKMPDQLRPETLQAFYILSASIPIVVISSGCVGILTAYQRFDLINAVRAPLGLTNFIVPLLVLPFSTSLVPITLLLAVSRLVSCVAQYWLCARVMPSLRMKKRFIPGAVKPLFGFGGWMTVSNIIGPLMVYLDRFVIGAVISVTAVAYYATPYEMVTKLWIISGALVTSLFPAFAASNKSDAGRTVQLISKSIAAIFILIFPIVLIIVTFSQEGLMLWLGKDFANNSATVLQWLAAGVFINCLAQVIYTLIQGQGRPDLTAKIHLLELAFYLPLLWWILKQYGIVGAAIAWTLRVVVDAILLMWVAHRMNPLVHKLVVKLTGYAFMASLALALCAYPDSLAIRSILFACISLCLLAFSVPYLRRNRLLGLKSPGTVRVEATHSP
ncbi:MAG: flippase [Geobacteraceae bacterium]|nr:flippase [Geobacteraceae bacterium]